MPVSDTLFTGSIPELYNRYLVPLIFEAPAHDLVDRALRADPQHILETAAGTGVVTRRLSEKLPASARVVATDLNTAMLDHAAAMMTGDSRFTWRQADALALPFADAQFDVVLCQFGVMFFPDKVQGYREARRVLKPGGVFIFNVWDKIETNEFALVVTRALATVFPDDPPSFMARTPHGTHDVKKIRQDLAAAGFSSVEVESFAGTSRAPSASDVAIAYCQGTPLRNEIETRDATRLDEATRVAAAALARQFSDVPIEGRIQAHVVTAKP